jgi:amino acid permease
VVWNQTSAICIAERRLSMNDNVVQGNQRAPKIATVSLFLGIGSLVVLGASVAVGFLVESIGIVNFFGVVTVLALAAIICGIMARKKSITEKLPGKRAATIGLIFGGISLFLTIFLIIAIFLFFIPWLGA